MGWQLCSIAGRDVLVGIVMQAYGMSFLYALCGVFGKYDTQFHLCEKTVVV